ncbi:MAG: signal peptidase I [bacterium]|nr:signal peptidase I [bacterium]
MKNVLYKAYEVTSIVILVCVSILGMLALYSKVNPNAHFRLLSVVSGSMKPAIDVGSGILIIRQPSYRINDVVTYRLGSQLVTHRIVFAHNYYLTKGDANSSIDPKTINEADIVGKVVASVPYIGFLQESTKNAGGLIAFIILPSVFIVLHESLIIIREMKKVNFNIRLTSKKFSVIIGIMFIVLPFRLPQTIWAFYTNTNSHLSLTISTESSSPSPSPTASASPSTSPSYSPFPLPWIGNIGNGAGSTNIVNVNESHTTIIDQTNTSIINNTVIIENNAATSSYEISISNNANSNIVVVN